MINSYPKSEKEIVDLLATHHIYPTKQRVIITRLIFEKATHLSAEEVYQLLQRSGQSVSKATVYNTLGVLAKNGIIREVIADPARVVYDPNTAPHHHFFNEATGELTDISAEKIEVSGLPALPVGAALAGVDVIVRLRPEK